MAVRCKKQDSILYFFALACFLISTNYAHLPQSEQACEFTVSSSKGKVAIHGCSSNVSFAATRSSAPSFDIDNLEARWSAGQQDHLLLSLYFSVDGSGKRLLKLSKSPTVEDPMFCGILEMSQLDQDSTAAVNVWLRCRQDAMELDDKLTLLFDELKVGRHRRSVTETIAVELPGCTLPEFKHTTLCQKEEEQKIRFHARRIPNRRSVRVVLFRSIYTSQFEDEERARGRRYHVAILEESPADVWFRHAGNLIEMQTLRYPNRNVRFRDLEAKKTYVISVWRGGEVKRYFKKITVC